MSADPAEFLAEWLAKDELVIDYLRGCHVEPDRILREVAAKRAILAEHQPSADGTCKTCIKIDEDYPQVHEYWEVVKWPCATVRALIAIYSEQRLRASRSARRGRPWHAAPAPAAHAGTPLS